MKSHQFLSLSLLGLTTALPVFASDKIDVHLTCERKATVMPEHYSGKLSNHRSLVDKEARLQIQKKPGKIIFELYYSGGPHWRIGDEYTTAAVVPSLVKEAHGLVGHGTSAEEVADIHFFKKSYKGQLTYSSTVTLSPRSLKIKNDFHRVYTQIYNQATSEDASELLPSHRKIDNWSEEFECQIPNGDFKSFYHELKNLPILNEDVTSPADLRGSNFMGF